MEDINNIEIKKGINLHIIKTNKFKTNLLAVFFSTPLVVILNDNEMSIGKNVGGMSRHLSRLRSSENYLDAKKWYRRIVKKLPCGNAIYLFTSRLKNRLKRFLLPAL